MLLWGSRGLESEQRQKRLRRLEGFTDGRDELNLAEFPLAAVCDRFLDGEKTVVFEDTVWDEEKRKRLPRKLTISGSDRFGLPTAKDDDVLLACIQLSSLGEFHSREVRFSRYELLKLLRWPDQTRYYRRLATSLRRWKGLTVYSDRAFYDKARRSWVNRDFGVFDNLYLYEREESEKGAAPADSWLVWNEVVYESFQAGYLKKLDWDLYLRLKDPVAKRLYRFLDKRFYHADRLTIDLKELAFQKVRMSPNYNTAQAKRALMKGIRELEHLWELRPMPSDERFAKVARGQWEVHFSRAKKPPRKASAEAEPKGIAAELTKRGVASKTAANLAKAHPRGRIEAMVELFDWHQAKGDARGPGFLVAGVKSSEPYKPPPGFVSRAEERHRKEAKAKAERERERSEQRRRNSEQAAALAAERPFRSYWNRLGPAEQEAFTAEALRRTDKLKRDGYERLQAIGGLAFEQYRDAIRREHFLRQHPPSK